MPLWALPISTSLRTSPGYERPHDGFTLKTHMRAGNPPFDHPTTSTLATPSLDLITEMASPWRARCVVQQERPAVGLRDAAKEREPLPVLVAAPVRGNFSVGKFVSVPPLSELSGTYQSC